MFHRSVSVIGLAALAACSAEKAQPRSTLTDDFGDTLVVASAAPARIVSLNPTTTEILFALGAGARVVGRTTYDQFPAEVKQVPDLGQGLRPNVEAIIGAHPQLAVLYASNDNRDAARRLRAAGITTAAYKVDRIADFARVTLALGRLIGDTAAARRTVDSVNATLDRVRASTAPLKRPTVFWPFWEAPLLSVGHGSFVDELIEIAGARNVFTDLEEPSPAVAFEELVKRDPDIVVMGVKSRERALKDPKWKALRAVRENHLLVVDSTIIIGPSVRLGAGAEMLARVFHPDVRF